MFKVLFCNFFGQNEGSIEWIIKLKVTYSKPKTHIYLPPCALLLHINEILTVSYTYDGRERYFLALAPHRDHLDIDNTE